MGVYYIYYGVVTILFFLLVKYKFYVSGGVGFHYKRMMNQMNRQMRFFTLIASVFLALIIGCRSDHQGVDLYNTLGTGYFYIYHKINEDSIPEIIRNFATRGNAANFRYANFEIGFVIFCRLLGRFWENPQVLLLGCAVLSILPVGWFICKCSKNKWLSLALFIALPCFATTMFSGIRQGIALGIVMMSYEFVRKKKLMPFVIVILVASLFHSSAVVALAAYPAYHIRIERKSTLLGGILMLAVIYFMKRPLFWILARMVSGRLALQENNSINLFLLLTCIFVLCVLFCKRDDYEARGFTNILWLACAAQAFSGIHTLASRVTWYFMMILVVLIPNILVNMNIKEKYILRPLSWVIGCATIFLGLHYLKNNSMAQAYPYIPFWSMN